VMPPMPPPAIRILRVFLPGTIQYSYKLNRDFPDVSRME